MDRPCNSRFRQQRVHLLHQRVEIRISLGVAAPHVAAIERDPNSQAVHGEAKLAPGLNGLLGELECAMAPQIVHVIVAARAGPGFVVMSQNASSERGVCFHLMDSK